MSEKENIFIGAAWPYANGSLHLGHVGGLLGADIIARYHRLRGDQVLFVSGSDCHGTPITVTADREKVEPSVIAERFHKEFTHALVDGLGFSYDTYTTTTTVNHSETVQEIFLKLYNEGYIYTKEEELPFCTSDQRFLPDRYIEGECPICHFNNARGDQCDECGNLLDPSQLKQPRCKLCAQTPEWRPSKHFYLRIEKLRERIRTWAEQSTGWRNNSRNFTLSLLKNEIPDRAITRDTDWGVSIPVKGYETKRIYVWFEAVCGYLSASKEWAQGKDNKEAWREFWDEKASVIHYYVHGKDNIPFHTIIWPAILLAHGGLHLPDRIISSEYLTLEKRQFSKSRNWAVWLPDFLKRYDSETLRYFLIASGPENADADFSWKDYQVKTNSELIGKLGNLVHRTLSQIKTKFPNGIQIPSITAERNALLTALKNSFDVTGQAIHEGRFRDGLQAIFEIITRANKFLSDNAPWKSIDIDPAKAEGDLATISHVIKCLMILIEPYLPKTAQRIQDAIGNQSNATWSYPELSDTKIQTEILRPLYRRIEDDEIEEEIRRLG